MVKWFYLILLSLWINSLTYAETTIQLLQQEYAVKASAQTIRINVTLSSNSVWEREQIIVNVSATTPDLFSSLQQEPFRIKGLDIYPVKPTTERINLAGGKQEKLQAGWILYPITDGQYQIKLPDIQYELNGVIRHTIPIPTFTINVKALPAYIPPTLPVGKIAIEQSFSSEHLVNTNTLTYWKLTLKGEGLPAQWLPAVLRQIQSNENIHYSPVTSERSNTATAKGMQSQVIHTIPLKALVNGKLKLPDLHVQSFDPADGRLKTLAIEKNSIYALSYIWRTVLILVLGGLVYKGFKQINTYLHRKRLERKRRKEALQNIGQAKSAYEIRSELNQLALAENWPGNLSIGAWYSLWNSKYRHQKDLDSLLGSLSTGCYSKQHIKPGTGYQDRFISCITKARKNPSYTDK